MRAEFARGQATKQLSLNYRIMIIHIINSKTSSSLKLFSTDEMSSRNSKNQVRHVFFMIRSGNHQMKEKSSLTAFIVSLISILNISKQMGCCTPKPHLTRKGTEQNQQINDENQEINNPTDPILQDFENVPDHPLFMGELRKATFLFSNSQYSKAAVIYKSCIQKHPEGRVEIIDGVGQVESSIGYYEWNLFDWYREGVEKNHYLGTAYDALSLCYLALKDDEEEMERGIKWYQVAVDDYPQNLGLVFGLANILNNKCNYLQAINYYNKAHDLVPKWTKPLQCLAFIFEYKVIDKAKGRSICHRTMEIQPNNMIGGFILARNQTSVDTRIQVLKGLNVMYPRYARALNEIGLSYGGVLKNYEQSLIWYKRAIEVAPHYASCYNNMGVTYEMMKKYWEAVQWYFKSIQKDRQYKDPHKNMSDIIDRLKLTDQQIEEQMMKYQIETDYFYYHIGLAYQDKGRLNIALRYYHLALDKLNKLSDNVQKVYNSMGIVSDGLGDNHAALLFYAKSIEKNPSYHSPYFNTAMIYKKTNNISESISWFKKVISVNPRFSQAYSQLGHIYKDQLKYEEAIKLYKKAVEHRSNDDQTLVNLGICYLKLDNYREGFNMMQRVHESLPSDNNNLSNADRKILKEFSQKIWKEGENWRMDGCTTTKEQKQRLKQIVNKFQFDFTRLLQNKNVSVLNIQKIMKPEILQIIKVIYEDKFELNKIDKIFTLVWVIFRDNEDYFHIIPQLFIQYFSKNTICKQKSIQNMERNIKHILIKMSAKILADNSSPLNQNHRIRQSVFTLKHFQHQKKVNLFKNVQYFNNYTQIYNQIMSFHQSAKQSYQDFKKLVDFVKKESFGTLFEISMKIPKNSKEQFKVMLRILQNIFKTEITQEKVNYIIEKIDEAIRNKGKKSSKVIPLTDVLQEIMGIWIQQISGIVAQRKKKNIKTVCEINDLLMAKIMFNTEDHLKDAVKAVDEMCFLKGYTILELEKRQIQYTSEVIELTIQIKQAVCQLQLILTHQQSPHHFNHCIQEIYGSPLGCIFGSYLFLLKEIQYPFFENCKDIIKYFNFPDKQNQDILSGAQFIVETLEGAPFPIE